MTGDHLCACFPWHDSALGPGVRLTKLGDMPWDPVELVAEPARITFLTGAGLSTASGIPDFRGPDGLWTRDPRNELISSLSHYLSDPEIRQLAWQYRATSGVWQARPTLAHRAIAAAEQAGRVEAVITQNTDGLHQVAGSRRVLEVHGSMRTWRCEDCRAEGPMPDMIARVTAGEADPRCPTCGGIARATTILFGEGLDHDLLDECAEAVARCDVLIAAGTSLTVQPVAGLVPFALGHGCHVIIANAEETPWDDRAHAVLRGELDTVLPNLLGVDR